VKLFQWRFLRRAAAGLILLIVMAGVGIAIYLRSTIAPASGTFTVTHLGHPVTISFDAYERPYVRAETLEDALFAEGWLHASHRLWQMELFRRAGKGRLAELLGAGMLESDTELWRMGVPQLAVQLEKNASADMQRYIEAYVHGINEAIVSDSFGAIEYLLLRKEPEPWQTGDVYALGALMAFQSAGNSEHELLRLALFEELGEDRAAVFLTHDDAQLDFPYVLPPAIKAGSGGLTDALHRMAATDPADTALMPRFAFGSNGWVVSANRSSSGNALFAFDSHDDLGLPNLFYEVHLFFGDGRQIRGWSVAGLPGVVNGYNERIAWGFTNIGDTQDLFVETRSEENPALFKDGDTWYEARTEIVEIPVAGREAPERITITQTKNGPLISENPPIALRWTIQDIDGMGIDSIMAFNLARNWDEFTAALDGFAAPSLNATYADIDGNIGFRTAGLLPIRGHGVGLVPLAGDDPGNRWQGYVAAENMPEVLNPPTGFIAAANARVNSIDNPPLVSADNAPGYRIRRLHAVLSSRTDFTVDDMRILQRDWYDQQAALLLPALLSALEGAELSDVERAALTALHDWQDNPLALPELGAPLIFQAWYRALAIEVFRPAMSEALFKHLFRNNYALNHSLDRLVLHDTGSTWWRDDSDTIIRNAFSAAVDEIRDVQGDSVAAWRLDRVHRVKLEHELGKAVPQLAWLFNADPAPWGGSTATVGRARYRYDRAYDVTSAATMRVVGEMKPPAPHMQVIIPGGQSGHPLSPHYTDQFRLWLNGESLPIAQVAEDVDGSSLVLTPDQ